MLKKDNLRLGLALGLITPVVVFFIIYFLRFSAYPLADFFEVLQHESRLITFVSAWCLVANIGVFTLYINNNKYTTAKGIFIITVVYGIMFLVTKYLIR